MVNLVEAALKFPPQKQSVQMALSKLDDPETALNEIANIIVTDSVLTSAILKLANSPLYGFAKRVSSIAEACVLLGRYSLRNLVLSLSVYEQFKNSEIKVIDQPATWEHSLLTGCIGRQLASSLHIDKEAALTTGILHKLGKLILAWADAERYQQVIDYQNEFDEQDFKAEKSLLNHHHAEIGAKILSNWNVPEQIVAAIQYYPNQYQTPDEKLSALLAISSALAQWELNSSSPKESFAPPKALTSYLNIETEQLATALESAKLDYKQMKIN